MDAQDVQNDLTHVLMSREDVQDTITDLARQIDRDYADKDLLIVAVLKGAVMVVADLTRALHSHVELDFMAVSSYGSGTKSSGVVRILKDLDADLTGRHVLIVEDIIDSGLTLSWLKENLESRGAASVEICALLRKPDAVKVEVPVRYVGFDIPNEFVVGYGLDIAQQDTQHLATGLKPSHGTAPVLACTGQMLLPEKAQNDRQFVAARSIVIDQQNFGFTPHLVFV